MAERRKKAAVKRPKAKTATKKALKTAKKTAKVTRAKKAESKAAPKINTLSVFDLNGKSVDTLTLDPMFHEGKVNTDVIYQAVIAYQAGQREGTASTKDRGAVSGGGKKPWKQKGTGRARHASIRSPLWTGGGVTFGPHPRDYSYEIPREIRRKAVAESVKSMASNGKLIMLKDLTLADPKTKNVARIISTFKVERPLFVVDKKTNNLVLASRNIPGVAVKTADEVNALDVASHRSCLMTQGAYTGLLKRLKS